MKFRDVFFQKIFRAPSGCIEWIGAKRNGYGLMSVDGKMRPVTHVSWFLKYGVWPTKHMLHHCDNRACVKIAHLYEGDDADNARDRDSRGRLKWASGEDASWSRLTQAQVDEIRARACTSESADQIAKDFDISPGYVFALRHGRSWARSARPVNRKPTSRDVVKVRYNGAEVTIADLSAITGLSTALLRSRHKRGLVDDALVASPHAGSMRARAEEIAREHGLPVQLVLGRLVAGETGSRLVRPKYGYQRQK